jgi:hypothetical protein
MKLTFSDAEIEIDGPMRIATINGHMHVAGNGMLLSITSEAEGEELIKRFS